VPDLTAKPSLGSFSLHLQEFCSEIPPFVAETLGFSLSRAANLQRICSKNQLQARSKRASRPLHARTVLP
jgi:hypothetical protein